MGRGPQLQDPRLPSRVWSGSPPGAALREGAAVLVSAPVWLRNVIYIREVCSFLFFIIVGIIIKRVAGSTH